MSGKQNKINFNEEGGNILTCGFYRNSKELNAYQSILNAISKSRSDFVFPSRPLKCLTDAYFLYGGATYDGNTARPSSPLSAASGAPGPVTPF